MALGDNIVAYWKLDESSGNAVDAVAGTYTLTNNGTTGFSSGLIGNGITIDSASKSFTKTTSLGLTYTSSRSVSGWIKPSGDGGGGHVAFMLPINNIQVFIAYDKTLWSGGTNTLRFNRSKAGIADVWITYATTLSTSSWTHVVFTFDGSSIKGYMNGSQVGSTVSTSGNGSLSGGTVTRLGAYDGTNYPRAGMLDEWGVWNRALSSTEVSQLYNSGSGLQYPFSTTSIKSINGLAYGSIKSINGLAIGSMKNFMGLA